MSPLALVPMHERWVFDIWTRGDYDEYLEAAGIRLRGAFRKPRRRSHPLLGRLVRLLHALHAGELRSLLPREARADPPDDGSLDARRRQGRPDLVGRRRVRPGGVDRREFGRRRQRSSPALLRSLAKGNRERRSPRSRRCASSSWAVATGTRRPRGASIMAVTGAQSRSGRWRAPDSRPSISASRGELTTAEPTGGGARDIVPLRSERPGADHRRQHLVADRRARRRPEHRRQGGDGGAYRQHHVGRTAEPATGRNDLRRHSALSAPLQPPGRARLPDRAADRAGRGDRPAHRRALGLVRRRPIPTSR